MWSEASLEDGGHLYCVLAADLYAISIEPPGKNNQVIISSERARS